MYIINIYGYFKNFRGKILGREKYLCEARIFYSMLPNYILGSSRLSLKGDSGCVSCPVCMRDFKDSTELDETVTELKRYSKNLPKKMEAIDVKIKETEAKVQAMINMKPTKESYERLKNYELVELKTLIDNIDRNVMPKVKKELKENVDAMKRLETLKGYSENIQSEIVIIDKYADEVSALQKKIDQQSLTLGSVLSLWLILVTIKLRARYNPNIQGHFKRTMIYIMT